MVLTKSSKATSIEVSAFLCCCIAFIHSKDGDWAFFVQWLIVNHYTANACRDTVGDLDMINHIVWKSISLQYLTPGAILSEENI